MRGRSALPNTAVSLSFVISVPLFFAAVFLGLPSIACRTSAQSAYAKFGPHSDIHSFRRYFDTRAEREERSKRAERREESDNLFSRVSRRCCSYAASFFVYHVRIGEEAFLPADRGIKQDFTDEAR